MNKRVDPCTDFYAFTCGSGDAPMSFDLSDQANTVALVKLFQNPDYFATAVSHHEQSRFSSFIKMIESIFDFNGCDSRIIQGSAVNKMKAFYDKCTGTPDYSIVRVQCRD